MGDIIDLSQYRKKSNPPLEPDLYKEKAIILSITMTDYLDKVPIIKDNKLIQYFTKVAQRKRTLEDLHFFSFRYYWSSKMLRYPLEEILKEILSYGYNCKNQKDLLFDLGLLFNLNLFFYENINTKIKLSLPNFVDTGLEYFQQIDKFKQYF